MRWSKYSMTFKSFAPIKVYFYCVSKSSMGWMVLLGGCPPGCDSGVQAASIQWCHQHRPQWQGGHPGDFRPGLKTMYMAVISVLPARTQACGPSLPAGMPIHDSAWMARSVPRQSQPNYVKVCVFRKEKIVNWGHLRSWLSGGEEMNAILYLS